MQAIINKLRHSFAGVLDSCVLLNGNEYHLEIKQAQVLKVCTYLQKELDAALVSLFANDERKLGNSFVLYYVWALRAKAFFIILKTKLDEENPTIQSITPDIHAAHLYERELQDLYGIIPLGHPDQRGLIFHGNWPRGHCPLRKDFDYTQRPEVIPGENNFKHIGGEGVYEIPVGPVHAGIIEPGHFRFSVAGEPIIHLEARLYYVHKGIEKLAEGCSPEKGLFFAERISGDETFTNSLAFCLALEKIAGVAAPRRAAYSRVIFGELERLTSHLGDLTGICVDVGFGFVAFQFRMLRGWCYQLAEELIRSRFLRNINTIGGVRQDFLAGKKPLVQEALAKIQKELDETVRIIRTKALFIDRVENTGVLQATIAKDMNAVGPAGRAAGLHFDMRKDFPYSAYEMLDFQIPRHHNGDVNCRMNVKIEECFVSMELIRQTLEVIPRGEVSYPLEKLPPYRSALGYTEAPRGENIHWVMTGENNTIFRYKIRTPSFCNWPALGYAVQGNIVPDFPLINKSFNLSYAGNDL